MSSPFFGDAHSCNEALSSLSVGEDGLSGGFAGAGGGHCLGDCIAGASFAGRGAGRGRGSTDGCAGAGPELAGQLRASRRRAASAFYCWESPAEVFGGLDAPRARTSDTRGGVRLEVGECSDESGAVRVGGKSRSR